jgi:hypothetical protein
MTHTEKSLDSLLATILWIVFISFILFTSWYLDPEPELNVDEDVYEEKLSLSPMRMSSMTHTYTLNDQYMVKLQLTGFWAEESESHIRIWDSSSNKKSPVDEITIIGPQAEKISLHRPGQYKISGMLVGHQYFPDRYPGLFPISHLEISAHNIKIAK